MNRKSFCLTAGIIFIAIALLHLLKDCEWLESRYRALGGAGLDKLGSIGYCRLSWIRRNKAGQKWLAASVTDRRKPVYI